MTWWNIDTNLWPGPSGETLCNGNGALILEPLRSMGPLMRSGLAFYTVYVTKEQYDAVTRGQLVHWSDTHQDAPISEKRLGRNYYGETLWILEVMIP